MRKRETRIKRKTLFWGIVIFLFLIWLFWPTEDPLTNDHKNDNPLATVLNEDNNISYNNTPSFDENYTEKRVITDNYSSITEMHWNHMPLKYKFSEENSCGATRKSRIVKTFNELNKSTNQLVSFIESEDYDIFITCNSSSTGEITYEDGYKYTTLAEGGITDYLDNVIISATLNFYPLSYTGGYYPSTEIHEILHGFGFNHNNKSCMMMSAVDEEECHQITSIDDKIVSCLNYIYSNGNGTNTCLGQMYPTETFETFCSDGWYPVVGTEYCCPEPNMKIEDGYCV